ncbi:MAG: KdsC family phosphatase [Pseudohongiellaceae bacterium]
MNYNEKPESVRQRASEIKLLLLDVDGVLTDGRLYFSDSGEEMKAFSALDGHGIRMLMAADIEVGIVTGRSSELVARRSAELGISLLLQDKQDKLAGTQKLCRRQGLALEQVCYAGDDLPDLPAMQAVGLALTVPGAHADIRSRAAAITEAAAGNGAVREITDFLLHARGLYPQPE